MLSTSSCRRSLLLGACLLSCAGLLPSPASASPVRVVGDFTERALAAINIAASSSKPDHAETLSSLVRETFDLPVIAKLSLGKAWRTASPDQRSRYEALFGRYVEALYLSRLEDFRRMRIEIGAARPAGRDQVVESVVVGGETPIRLDWRLRERDGRYRVIDLVVEGVSLVMTQRSEFAAVLERHGGDMERFLHDLERKLAAQG